MIQRIINNSATIVFDCDGVVLDSNKVKTQAFYNAAIPYGEEAAYALVDYHVKHGGVSRYQKFQYFIDEIVGEKLAGFGFEVLLDRYAEFVMQGLHECKMADSLVDLRAATPNQSWVLVSGGDQRELRSVFKARGIEHLFDGGIFGSPDNKIDIFTREIGGNIKLPAVYIGDSKYDYYSSAALGLDFIFLAGWSEVYNWEAWVEAESLSWCNDISEILRLL
ncbi:HAD family hydrolase [Alcanivorax sediminis]|uniref:HAD hydrolase-like protein n=1 Tax=Alcanivorax sediminis TaxID=2663008 RepID=A0A6N7LYU6_9GAMM|nr:HAD family hydrolase [Alcanivorax sediminis]MQX54354.1 HAD hydrolase-like protein [Alcanivorax sediminis]